MLPPHENGIDLRRKDGAYLAKLLLEKGYPCGRHVTSKGDARKACLARMEIELHHARCGADDGAG